jgi:hypothetical protein
MGPGFRQDDGEKFAVIASEAKQSMPQLAEVWIASSLQRKIASQFYRELLAMTSDYILAARSARALPIITPLNSEGAGNAGRSTAPAASCAVEKHTS